MVEKEGRVGREEEEEQVRKREEEESGGKRRKGLKRKEERVECLLVPLVAGRNFLLKFLVFL